MKILILIIASDNEPIYKSLQDLWRLQFNIHPEIDCFFVKCNPAIDTEYVISHETNTIFVKAEESLHYGITFKTLMAMKALSSNYEFTLRTNLSSFYVLEKLYDLVSNFSRTNCFAGILGEAEGVHFVSGCGFLISQDISEYLVANINSVWDSRLKYDDLCFGKIIFSKFPTSFRMIPRHDIIHFPSESVINDDCCHYRIKVDANRDYDLEIRKRCLNYYYPNLK